MRAVSAFLIMLAASLTATFAHAHGDVTPQAVDTSSLKQLGENWVTVNPYRGNKDAIRIGDSAFNQNCARCHGLGGVSGGIAPEAPPITMFCLLVRFSHNEYTNT